MGIWIRRQDKSALINANKINIADFHDLFKNAIWGDDVFLGEYSTKEKALKVLDEIQEFIVYYENISNMVYQMPQDDIVETD